MGKFSWSLLALAVLGCTLPHHSAPPPLIAAARCGDVEMIQELARAGVDLNETWGVNNWPPLVHAIHKNRRGAVRALLAAGANANHRGGHKETPLMLAAGYGQEDIVADLLQAGADPELRDVHGSTALDFAILGVADIDRFTLTKCQAGTVQVLMAAAPGLQPNPGRLDSLVHAVLKSGPGCREMFYLVAARTRTAGAQ